MDRIGHNPKRTMSAAEFQRAAAEFENRVRSLIRNPGDLHNLHKARSFADRIRPYKYVDKVLSSDCYAVKSTPRYMLMNGRQQVSMIGSDTHPIVSMCPQFHENLEPLGPTHKPSEAPPNIAKIRRKYGLPQEEESESLKRYRELDKKRKLGEKLSEAENSLLEHYIKSAEIPLEKLSLDDMKKRVEFYTQKKENLAEAAQNTEGKVVNKLANWAKSIFSRINFRKMVK